MPTDYDLGFDDYEYVCPPGPGAAQGSPEQAIKRVQPWARMFAVEHGDLLPEGEDLNCKFTSTNKENAERGEEVEGKSQHKADVVAHITVLVDRYPLRRLFSMFNNRVVGVNNQLIGGGEFSTGVEN